MPFLFQLILGVGLQLLSFLFRPKAKKHTTPQQDIKKPTSDAGRPIPVVMGSVQIKDPNCLYFGQAFHYERESDTLAAEGGA